ncbi:unnamed protein product [Spodoptera littoralis]|uniref:Uncharacterized protein n=1 Tax=Spodoptera littoralis TaxID=7109 RepID=A0A9P0N3G4_SPOLI|nr:unnamed protein product [Spodoptera littoralis]
MFQDETFPELQAATGESADGESAADPRPGDEAEDRGGAAFPKAFDRELVTPTALQQQSTEDRRKSLLDQHWAIPSKDRMSIDQGSEISSTADAGKEESTGPEPEAGDSIAAADGSEAGDAPEQDAQHLVKLSYHDSGIDIRDPLLHVTPANSKKGSLIDCDDYYHEIDTIYESKELEIDRDWHRDAAHALQCFIVLHKNADARSDSVYSSCDEVYSDADIVLSAEWVPPVCLARGEPPLSAPPHSDAERARKTQAVSFSLDNAAGKDDAKPDKKNKMLKRLSYPLSWVEGLTGEGGAQGSQSDSLPTSADSHNSTSVFSKVFNRRSSLGGFGRSHTKSTSSAGSAPPPRLDYRSMVSVDDMPDLFASFDKLIPRPARPSDDPPLYLRLRMGKPIGRPLPRTTPLMSYGRKRMKPEYWFGVPRNRQVVDDLFKFLTHWVPDRYGPLGDVSAQGYELIDSDTEWDDDEAKPGHKDERTGSTGDVSDLTRESWELLKAPYVKIYSIMKSQAEALGDSLGEEPRQEVPTSNIG